MKRNEPQSPACLRCHEPIAEDQRICACGLPTSLMTFEERARFEVEQWRAYMASRESA